MEPILVMIDPNGETYHDYPHTGEEFGYVIEGEVIVCYGDVTRICKKGESFYFVSNKQHYLRNESDSVAKVLWVSCPPNF